jgi:hypothetical protein
MSADLLHDYDPDDPVEILRNLPPQLHDQFRAEYTAAAENARYPEGYRALHAMLRRWRLTAVAHAAPGFDDRLAAIREAIQTGSLDGSVPIEEVFPGWPARFSSK